jgi:hypothetical protein
MSRQPEQNSGLPYLLKVTVNAVQLQPQNATSACQAKATCTPTSEAIDGRINRSTGQ